MRFLPVLGLAALLPAQNVLVYDNGSYITDPTAGSGGAPVSVLQSVAPMYLNTFGSNVNTAFNYRQADDFTVNSLLLVNEIEVFFYSTNATTPNAGTLYLSLWNGNPTTGTPTQLLPGAGATTNLFTAAGYTVTNTMTGAYRVTSTTLTSTARQIQSLRVVLPSTLTLTAGTYWLEMAVGVNTSNPTATTAWVPYLTTPWVFMTGNAQLWNGTAYSPLQQNQLIPPATTATPAAGAFQGIPFRLYGPAQSAQPGAITNLGGGCSTTNLVLRGSPVIGGHLHASLTNITPNPLQFRSLILGLTDPNVPLGVCACVSHASLDVLVGFASDPANPNNPLSPTASPATPFGFELQVPMTAALVGFTLYAQGLVLDFGAPTACTFAGLPLELTDGYEFRLNVN
jgi:hypothetical protein